MDRLYKISTMRQALRTERRHLLEDGETRAAGALAEFLDNAEDESYARLYDILEAAIEKVQG